MEFLQSRQLLTQLFPELSYVLSPSAQPLPWRMPFPFSLTHKRGHIAMAWTSIEGIQAVGLDLECAQNRGGEWLKRRGFFVSVASEHESHLSFLFPAWEAGFKALSCLYRKKFPPHEVNIEQKTGSCFFEVFLRKAPQKPRAFVKNVPLFLQNADYILSFAWILKESHDLCGRLPRLRLRRWGFEGASPMDTSKLAEQACQTATFL